MISLKIVMVLAAATDHCMEIDELAVAMGLSRRAMSNAIERLHNNGIVVVRGDTIALSQKASQNVKKNEIIRHGRRIVWGPRADQLDLFAAALQTATPSPASDEGRR